MNNQKTMKKEDAFTLVEMLVVIMIIGLLAAVVVPRVIKGLGKAESATAKMQIENFKSALLQFRMDMGRFPTESDGGLKALIEAPSEGADRWMGPYLENTEVVPKDPWGEDYIYKCPGENSREYEIVSYGADKQEGGESENKDILSWKAAESENK